jgi:heme/copper-type cytochrome/quinol oxidase subunit 3
VVFPALDAFTFSALLITYGLIRFSHPAYKGDPDKFTFSQEYWPIPERVFEAVPFLHGVHLPLVFVGIMTFVLIMSSVTMVLAVEAGHRNDRNDVEKWMLWTILGRYVPGVPGLGMVALHRRHRRRRARCVDDQRQHRGEHDPGGQS